MCILSYGIVNPHRFKPEIGIIPSSNPLRLCKDVSTLKIALMSYDSLKFLFLTNIFAKNISVESIRKQKKSVKKLEARRWLYMLKNQPCYGHLAAMTK